MISQADVGLLRVVVASPSDVQPERDAVAQVVDEFNRGIARDRMLRLELYRWETDAYPGFHPEGPQGLIDSELQIPDCDLLVGIFWRRFGTPTKDSASGTEHEFRLAYEAWQQNRRPQIMMYFNQRPYAPKTKAEADQWGLVLEFKSNFPEEGLWWPYRGTRQFKDIFREHLTKFVLELVPSNPNFYIKQKTEAVTKDDVIVEKVRPYVRERANRHFQTLHLKDMTFDIEEFFECPPLATNHEDQPELMDGFKPRKSKDLLSALEILNRNENFIFFGARTSGKTTLANYFAVKAIEGIGDWRRVPVVLGPGALQRGSAGFRRAARAYYLDIDEDVTPLVMQSEVLCLLDDFNPHSPDEAAILSAVTMIEG
jgi:hypothetical protein